MIKSLREKRQLFVMIKFFFFFFGNLHVMQIEQQRVLGAGVRYPMQQNWNGKRKNKKEKKEELRSDCNERNRKRKSLIWERRQKKKESSLLFPKKEQWGWPIGKPYFFSSIETSSLYPFFIIFFYFVELKFFSLYLPLVFFLVLGWV